MRLKDRIAIVTGAGSGFGAGIAETFAREGARVTVADINGAAAGEIAGRLGATAVAVTGDVSTAGGIKAIVDRTVETFGTPDIVVNNAGITHRNQSMLEVDEATFDRIFAVNVKAIYLMARAVVPLMKAAGGGVIINIGSTAGIRPRPGLTWYNASKGAVNLLSKSMAVELAPYGIRVNAICPVIGTTGLLEEFMGQPDTPENRAKFIATIPLGRMSTPRDIANAALYLASDEADMITGIELPVDGGRTI